MPSILRKNTVAAVETVKSSREDAAPQVHAVKSSTSIESLKDFAVKEKKPSSLDLRKTLLNMRQLHVNELAGRVWGNNDDARGWLNTPHMELHGATPASLLKTETGAKTVEDLLSALENGFPV